jgi:crotonobetainyl-CoA:carnitine CoA-transferase CaiB-like acyl-CoA transferase
MLLEVAHASGGNVPLVASPLKIPTSPVEVRYPPPLLGQHTDEILSSVLGFDAGRIQQLREDGVI